MLEITIDQLLKLDKSAVCEQLINMSEQELCNFLALIWKPENTPSISQQINSIFSNRTLWSVFLDKKYYKALLTPKGFSTTAGFLLTKQPYIYSHEIFFDPNLISAPSQTRIHIVNSLCCNPDWIKALYSKEYNPNKPMFVFTQKNEKIELANYISTNKDHLVAAIAVEEAEKGLTLTSNYPGLFVSFGESSQAVKDGICQAFSSYGSDSLLPIKKSMALFASLSDKIELHPLLENRIFTYLESFYGNEYDEMIKTLLTVPGICSESVAIVERHVIERQNRAACAKLIDSISDAGMEEQPNSTNERCY